MLLRALDTVHEIATPTGRCRVAQRRAASVSLDGKETNSITNRERVFGNATNDPIRNMKPARAGTKLCSVKFLAAQQVE
jgi:hypothetical protein